MGSLAPPCSPPRSFPSSSSSSSSSVDSSELRCLFQAQQRHLNHFFDNLDFTQTLSFAKTLVDAPGGVLFSGVGKSGLVARKLSQTLVSLGFSRSAFLSPIDALHGDIGALSHKDILVLLSKSGSSEELLKLVPCAKAKGATVIAITSVEGNKLAKICDMNVHLPVERELCPFNLAPVTSTAIQMVFGDTVAVALMGARRLTKEQYAANHPAGKIGKRLIFKVNDVMKKGEELPICQERDLMIDQLVELTSKGCGCLLIADDENHLIGTFTDGDLRRALKSNGHGIFKLAVGDMCNRSPRTISQQAMAVEAMQKMESPPYPVQFLPVVDDRNIVVGIITLHDLVSAGL